MQVLEQDKTLCGFRGVKMIGPNQEAILFAVTKYALPSKYLLRSKLHFSKRQLNDSIESLKKKKLVDTYVLSSRYRVSIVFPTPDGIDYLRRRFNYEGS